MPGPCTWLRRDGSLCGRYGCRDRRAGGAYRCDRHTVEFREYNRRHDASSRIARRHLADRCAACPSDKRLGVHHRNLDHFDNRPENLITLCWPCHQCTHKIRSWWPEAELRRQVRRFHKGKLRGIDRRLLRQLHEEAIEAEYQRQRRQRERQRRQRS